MKLAKRILIIIFIIFPAYGFTTSINAGYGSFSSNNNPIILSFDYGITNYNNLNAKTFGLSLDLEQKRITGNIKYSFGYTINYNKNHLYTSALASLGAVFLTTGSTGNSDSDDAIAAIATLLIIIPGNFTLHFWLSPYLDASLSLHPWGIEIFSSDEFLYSNGASLKLNFHIMDTIVIAPFFRYRHVYSRRKSLINYGGMLGVAF